MPTIAYQGTEGAYSHLACRKTLPDWDTLPCEDFQTAMRQVEDGVADRAMIPLENSTAGRVEEIYRLIPKTHLQIVGEHFEPVNHCLLGVKGSAFDDLKTVHSHPQALAQCLHNTERLGIRPVASVDTAVAAEQVAAAGDISRGAIASSLAAERYGLDILKENFQDVSGNTTRFVILAREAEIPRYEQGCPYVTSLLFTVGNHPASLYKALGGFATNGINLIKLESYMDGGTMEATCFHIDIDGHPEQQGMINAMEELGFYAEKIRRICTYEAHDYRNRNAFI